MEIDYPRALLVALALSVGAATVVAASTSGAAFGLYNPAWDGTSDLREVADDLGTTVTVTRNASAYGDGPANGTVAVVLAPGSEYGATESARVRSFVENGGTLLVADDFGPHANPLLAAVGARARFDGRLVRDEQHYHRGPALPVAGDVDESEYTASVDALTLNHGTAVEPNGATAVVNTSSVAYLDSNGDGALGDDEPIGPFSIVTVETVGEGTVVVVGDPSALINVMLERPGNRAFATAVFSAHDRVLLDHSNAESLPPLAAATLVLRDSPPLQVLVGVVAVGAVGLWARWPSIRRGRPAWLDRIFGKILGHVSGRARHAEDRAAAGPGTEVIASHLRRHHPEWEPERVERVVARVVGERGDETVDRSRNR